MPGLSCEIDPVAADLAVIEFRPEGAFEDSAAALDCSPRRWVCVIGADEDLGDLEFTRNLKSGVEACDCVPFSSVARRDVVANVPTFIGEERGVDIVTNSHYSYDVFLIVEEPAMRTWDDSSRKIYAILIIFERLNIGFEVNATFGVPFTIRCVIGCVIVQHPHEGIVVRLVEGYACHWGFQLLINCQEFRV